MLYTPVNHFNWEVNNFSDTYPGNAAATTLTADGATHTKGTNTAVLAGLAEDVYQIFILVSLANTSGTIRRQMIDLLIDPAAGVGNAGSSWSVAINNLYCNGPATSIGFYGCAYAFPLFLKAGTAIGARVQDTVGGAACRFSIRMYGKPTRPELFKVGSKVQTLGATTASTTGVTVVPGNASVGDYSASLGTLTNEAWWWQVGIGSADISITNNRYFFDIAHDATSKYICAQGIGYGGSSAAEETYKTAFGDRLPIRCAPAGTAVYVRGSALGAPDSSMTCVVYAVT